MTTSVPVVLCENSFLQNTHIRIILHNLALMRSPFTSLISGRYVLIKRRGKNYARAPECPGLCFGKSWQLCKLYAHRITEERHQDTSADMLPKPPQSIQNIKNFLGGMPPGQTPLAVVLRGRIRRYQ